MKEITKLFLCLYFLTHQNWMTHLRTVRAYCGLYLHTEQMLGMGCHIFVRLEKGKVLPGGRQRLLRTKLF